MKQKTIKLVKLALRKWNYKQTPATPYYISRVIGRSESGVVKALRQLKDSGEAYSNRGNWILKNRKSIEVTISLPEHVYNSIDIKAVKVNKTIEEYIEEDLIKRYSD